MKLLLRGYQNPLGTSDNLRLAGLANGFNSGNLVFATASQRILSGEGVEVSMTSLGGMIRRVEWVNENFDHVVIPLANVFRPGFIPSLDKTTNFIKKLTIPVTILGVGMQAKLNYVIKNEEIIREPVKRFIAASLDKGPSIGVRGHFTAEYIRKLGFSDVAAIGCPSMFFHGPNLPQPRQIETWSPETRVAFNVTPRVKHPRGWIKQQLREQPLLEYIAQDKADVEVMLGKPFAAFDSDTPGHALHPFFSENRTVLYFNAFRWLEDMKRFSFSYGSRIHGNIAALLAGVPAHVIVHDSRTRELAEFFDIPHTAARDLRAEDSARTLYEASDFDALISGHGKRFENFAAYLTEHGLPLATFDGTSEFDLAAMARSQQEFDVVRMDSSYPSFVAERARHHLLHQAQEAAQAQQEIDLLKSQIAALEAQVRQASSKTVPESKTLTALRKALGRLP